LTAHFLPAGDKATLIGFGTFLTGLFDSAFSARAWFDAVFSGSNL
jgi:hypothetical protein